MAGQRERMKESQRMAFIGSRATRFFAVSLVFLVLGCLGVGVAADHHSHFAMAAGGLVLGLLMVFGRAFQPLRLLMRPPMDASTICDPPRRMRAPTGALDFPLRI